ncbi:MAG: nucleotidyl transferase AbiEii/AbiGii toxin family protein [Chloroflexi bacterium]|nr:nucleotidyl transferase AbiEii/AbiGii toxin family protein [Chloroflexota bacterium]
MIRPEELRRLAARAGVRVELQERDYVLGWFLLGLAQTPALAPVLVFKGGTALRKMYFPDYRFSEDLDFTVAQPVDERALQTGIEAVCHAVYQASGITMQPALWRQTRHIPDEEAYQARIAYIGPLGRQSHQPPRITLDLTRYERLVLPPVRRTIHHPYSDAPEEPLQLPTYLLEEMLGEKLRALLRRCYPRDLYDVWYLLAHQGQSLNRLTLLRALEEKCRYKGYTFSSPEDFLTRARRENMEATWVASLRPLTPSLPDYGTVMKDLSSLLPDWLGETPDAG